MAKKRTVVPCYGKEDQRAEENARNLTRQAMTCRSAELAKELLQQAGLISEHVRIRINAAQLAAFGWYGRVSEIAAHISARIYRRRWAALFGGSRGILD